MTESRFIIEQIKAQGLLPLFFHKDSTTCISLMGALYNGGVRIVEYTNRGAEALANFTQMRQMRDAELPSLLLAAGTVKTQQDAENFIEAGADFIISPGLNEDVGRYCNAKGILWVPGCMTPSEIMKAEELGAQLIKLFPGSLLGPSFVTAIRELFPSLSFIPTGGVTLDKENLSAWFRSGVIGVGAGSTLISKSAIESGNFEEIEEATASAMNLVIDTRAEVFHNH